MKPNYITILIAVLIIGGGVMFWRLNAPKETPILGENNIPEEWASEWQIAALPEVKPTKGMQETETMHVKVYFSNADLDPEFSCEKVFSAWRKIPRTLEVGQASLEELLRGTTEEEKSGGYVTHINSGVNVKGLVIEDGVAVVNFDERLEFGVNDSCRAAAIRAQVAETLKQFPAVNDVVISVDGKTEGVLQP